MPMISSHTDAQLTWSETSIKSKSGGEAGLRLTRWSEDWAAKVLLMAPTRPSRVTSCNRVRRSTQAFRKYFEVRYTRFSTYISDLNAFSQT